MTIVKMTMRKKRLKSRFKKWRWNPKFLMEMRKKTVLMRKIAHCIQNDPLD